MPKLAANLTMLYTEHDFLDRFAAARADGFSAVEFMFPYDFPKQEVAAALKANDLKLVLHNLPAGDWAKGERGIAVLPDRRQEFRDGVARAVDYAHALDCGMLNCLVGLTPKGVDGGVVREALVENLRFVAERLEAAGIRFLVEPVNGHDIPGFYLDTVEKAGR